MAEYRDVEMFDLGLGIGEIIVLALVALIVVGPKDLPNLFYKIGKFLGHIRTMTAEFKYSMHNIAQEQEIENLKQQIKNQSTISFDTQPENGKTQKEDKGIDRV
jgi:sec-independent protein translocase protein TatB